MLAIVLHKDDGQQKWFEVREQVGRGHQSRRDDVEVHATEICAQPADPAEAVRVGHVAVEDGPREIKTDTDRSRPGPAVPARGRMTELMQGGRSRGEAENGEREGRVQVPLLRGTREPGA